MASHVDDDDDDAWSGSGCEAADEEPKVAAITDPSKLFATAAEALDFDKAQGFDLRICKVNDFYGAVKLVNFVRRAVADGVQADHPVGCGIEHGAEQLGVSGHGAPRQPRSDRITRVHTQPPHVGKVG